MGIENLVRMLKELSEILAEHSQPEWSEIFRVKSNELGTASTDPEASRICKGILESISGGAGSLNDLVLYQNGRLLKKETTRFHDLLEHIRGAAYQGLAELEDS